MISKRFIAIFLLVLYGVPAAIGPYWHHHGLSCSHESNGAKTIVDLEFDICVSSNVDSHCHVCHHDKDHCSASKSGQVNPKNGDKISLRWSEPDHSKCVICAYYSLPQAVAHFDVEVPDCHLVQPSVELHSKAIVSATQPWRARGPPSCVQAFSTSDMASYFLNVARAA